MPEIIYIGLNHSAFAIKGIRSNPSISSTLLIIPFDSLVNRNIIPTITTVDIKCGAQMMVCNAFLYLAFVISFTISEIMIGIGKLHIRE